MPSLLVATHSYFPWSDSSLISICRAPGRRQGRRGGRGGGGSWEESHTGANYTEVEGIKQLCAYTQIKYTDVEMVRTQKRANESKVVLAKNKKLKNKVLQHELKKKTRVKYTKRNEQFVTDLVKRKGKRIKKGLMQSLPKNGGCKKGRTNQPGCKICEEIQPQQRFLKFLLLKIKM